MTGVQTCALPIWSPEQVVGWCARFHLLADPDPGFNFDRLLPAAVPATTAGVRVLAAGLDDLMAMKRAAGRPKDRVELEILGALREELDRRT